MWCFRRISVCFDLNYFMSLIDMFSFEYSNTKIMKKIFYVSLFALLQIHQLYAQKSSTEIDSLVKKIFYGKENGLVNKKSVAGAAIGIYANGESHYYCYGFADKEKKISVDTATLFEIGSNTKIFTGLMLSEEIANRKMDSIDFIEKYVPVNNKIKNRVRLIDIANHISGLPTFHDSISLAELSLRDTSKDPLMMITDEYVLSVLAKTDSLHDYGEYEYSNLGVGLVGYILQQAEHSTYDNLLQTMICKPLNMQHTTALMDATNVTLARGYYQGEPAPFVDLCPAMQGAGAIKSNITDMMTFMEYQLKETGPLQKALTISHKKYYNSKDLQIAMGWHIGTMYGTEIYEMRGDTYGASSLMMFDKQDELAIVILLNSSNSGVVERTENTLLANLLDSNSDFTKRFAMPQVKVNKAILDSYAGLYELEKDFNATVSVVKDELNLQLTGQPGTTFKAVGDNWFVLEKYNCQLEFIKNENGNCKEFILHQNGQDISCKRIK
jgi:D-alanyl-D-alanine-carboxypeptidase/D-alanyl-D-alanine-endopeptidase